VACTESYNGSIWTTVGAMNTSKYFLAGAGTNTAALAFGGLNGTGTGLTKYCTESYNLIPVIKRIITS